MELPKLTCVKVGNATYGIYNEVALVQRGDSSYEGIKEPDAKTLLLARLQLEEFENFTAFLKLWCEKANEQVASKLVTSRLQGQKQFQEEAEDPQGTYVQGQNSALPLGVKK